MTHYAKQRIPPWFITLSRRTDLFNVIPFSWTVETILHQIIITWLYQSFSFSIFIICLTYWKHFHLVWNFPYTNGFGLPYLQKWIIQFCNQKRNRKSNWLYVWNDSKIKIRKVAPLVARKLDQVKILENLFLTKSIFNTSSKKLPFSNKYQVRRLGGIRIKICFCNVQNDACRKWTGSRGRKKILFW